MEHNSPTVFLFDSINQNESCFNPFLDFSPRKDLFSYRNEDEHLELVKIGEITKKIQKTSLNKRKYINIAHELRLELIEAVSIHGEKIKSAAKRLGINYSTAKAICQVFRKEGRNYRKIKTSKLKQSHQTSEKEPIDDISPIPVSKDSLEDKATTTFNEEKYLISNLKISKDPNLGLNNPLLLQDQPSQAANLQQCLEFPQNLTQNMTLQGVGPSTTSLNSQTITNGSFAQLQFPLNPTFPTHPYIIPMNCIAPYNAPLQQFFHVSPSFHHQADGTPSMNYYSQFNCVPNNQNNKIQFMNQAAYLVPQTLPMPPQVMEYRIFPYNPSQYLNNGLR